MKITFLGAVGVVTGSKYLVEYQSTKILVDCGLFQGPQSLTKRNWDKFAVDPKTIDAIVLTHAHIDHTGYIPALVKQGFSGKIYCSKPTADLCQILLIDSGSLQQEHAQELGTEPLYNRQDAQIALKNFVAINYNTVLKIKDLEITLISSHHILGSAFVIVSDGKTKLTFSGDLGSSHQLLMPAPAHLQVTDYLVLESTYGGRLHATGDSIMALREIVLQTIQKGGVLVIPAFAVGRTQAILYCLYQLIKQNQIPKIPIFLDSPMAEAVNELYFKYPSEHTLAPAQCQAVFAIATPTSTVEQSKELNNLKTPAIIIAGSGMASGGRVMYHLAHFITDAKNTIAFVGFQAPGTVGQELVAGAKTISLFDKKYQARAQIKMIETFSAHADSAQIMTWLKFFTTMPKKIFITHGEQDSAVALKKQITAELGLAVVVPAYLDSFDL